MREIKFRAWNNKTGCFYKWDLPMSFKGTSRIWGDVEQYTGLKDKNGVEIYEGDILTANKYPYVSDGHKNYVAVVQWCDENALFFSYPQAVSDRVRGAACGNDVFDDGQESAQRFEVIGNIHENPELLAAEADGGDNDDMRK